MYIYICIFKNLPNFLLLVIAFQFHQEETGNVVLHRCMLGHAAACNHLLPRLYHHIVACLRNITATNLSMSR